MGFHMHPHTCPIAHQKIIQSGGPEAMEAEVRKFTKYAELISAHEFCPFVVETPTGAMKTAHSSGIWNCCKVSIIEATFPFCIATSILCRSNDAELDLPGITAIVLPISETKEAASGPHTLAHFRFCRCRPRRY